MIIMQELVQTRKIMDDERKQIILEVLADKYCKQILALIENEILDKINDIESQVFFMKMQGDYYRYMSEYAQDDNLEDVK